MARIRTVKPEFFSSLTIARLDPIARLAFIGLWTYVDDEGRGVADPRLIKAALFPLDDDMTSAQVDVILRDLANAGLVKLYSDGCKPLLQVTGFAEHQRISKPTPSRLPPATPDVSATPPGALPESSATTPRRLRDDSALERKGKERKGTLRDGTGTVAEHPSAPPPDGGAFDRFWNTYPRRLDRGHAEKAWNGVTRTADPEAIIAGAAAFAAKVARERTEPKFVPHPATWLRGQRWLDDDGSQRPAVRILNGAVLDEGVL